MNGLMKKDFLTIRKKYGSARIVIDSVIIAAMFLILGGESVVYISCLLIPLEISSMITTLQTTDEAWRWNRYAVALPFSKDRIVKSRYAVALIMAALGAAVAVGVNLAAFAIFGQYSVSIHLLIAASAFLLTLLFLALIMPSNYSIGVNAGVAVMLILFGVLLVVGFVEKVSDVSLLGFFLNNLELSVAASVAAVLLLTAASYRVSVALLKRKYR